MAPRFKRKRQASQTSSSARTSQSSTSHSGRVKRPSIFSQSSSRTGQPEPHHNQTANRRHDILQGNPLAQPQHHHAADTDEVNEDLEQVVMAIDRQQKGTIGCAYYVAREEKLFCLQDVTIGSLEAIETCESFYG